MNLTHTRNFEKAALRGEPSYVWRAGQERRLKMILAASGDHIKGRLLENGCGVGMYLQRLEPFTKAAIGLEYDFERAQEAHQHSQHIVNAMGEQLPYASACFSSILSHEVLEHVSDDRACVEEMLRVLIPGGVILLFVPNRGYPFETHGVYWHDKYHFGNIPLVNYLPRRLRNKLAPHVRIYSRHDLERLFDGLPVHIEQQEIIFGGYDNIMRRSPRLGKVLKSFLQWLEHTPLKAFGLSQFWVIQKS